MPTDRRIVAPTSDPALTEALLTPRGRWRLVRYNDAAHLAGLGVDLSAEE